MDSRHFDALTRKLTEAGTRRGWLGLFATLTVLGGLVDLFTSDDAAAQGRRKRRKKRHKHGRPRRRRRRKRCKAKSRARTCAGKCGLVMNNCKKTVNCGPCTCDSPCPVCQTCNEATGICRPDPAQQGAACDPDQVCTRGGTCEGGACLARPCGGDAPVCNGVTCVSCLTQCGGGICVTDISGAVICHTGGVPIPPPCTLCPSDASCAAGVPCVVSVLTNDNVESLDVLCTPPPAGLGVCIPLD